jgi:hypothetical protein
LTTTTTTWLSITVLLVYLPLFIFSLHAAHTHVVTSIMLALSSHDHLEEKEEEGVLQWSLAQYSLSHLAMSIASCSLARCT